jgi:hypothetical protein
MHYFMFLKYYFKSLSIIISQQIKIRASKKRLLYIRIWHCHKKFQACSWTEISLTMLTNACKTRVPFAVGARQKDLKRQYLIFHARWDFLSIPLGGRLQERPHTTPVVSDLNAGVRCTHITRETQQLTDSHLMAFPPDYHFIRCSASLAAALSEIRKSERAGRKLCRRRKSDTQRIFGEPISLAHVVSVITSISAYKLAASAHQTG